MIAKAEETFRKLGLSVQEFARYVSIIRCSNRAQIVGGIIKYLLIALASVVILAAGYKVVNILNDRGCMTEITEFEIELGNLGMSLRYGEKEQQTFDVPCGADRIYIFDKKGRVNTAIFNEFPLMKDSLESGGNNIFLIKNGQVKRSFSIQNLDIVQPYYKCLMPKFGRMYFLAEGTGTSAKIESAADQPECTITRVNASNDEGRNIFEEAAEFTGIPDKDIIKSNIEVFKEDFIIDRQIQIKANLTEVLITITPKRILGKFIYIESFPKECIIELEKILQTARKTEDFEVIVKSDPLIIWKYETSISNPKNQKYILRQRIDEDCMSKINGLGITEN